MIDTPIQATGLTAEYVLQNLKARLQYAQKSFVKRPNSLNWNIQTREAFTFQQAFYFFNSMTRTYEEKQKMLVELSKVTNNDWGDVICKITFGESLSTILRAHQICP
jgi:hypothetical protein